MIDVLTVAAARKGMVKNEAGKGLSTNDYTNADKAKVDGIGDLSQVTTTDKTSIIAAINELVTRVEALENP